MKNRKLITSAMLGCLLFSQSVIGRCMALSMEDAVQMALVNNPDVAITRLNEDMARAELKQQRGKNSFSVKASANFSDSDNNDNGWQYGNSNGLSASLPLFNKSNQNGIKEGELGLDIAKLKTQRKWETMKLDVIKAYYDALEAKKQIGVYQDTVDKYAKHLTNVEQLYSAGSKAKIDVLRSQVELSNAQQSLIKGQNSYDNSLSKLHNLLYLDYNEPIELTDDFVYESFTSDVSSCVAAAMANRKELQIDKYTLQQKELAVSSAKADYYPTVNLNLNVGWNKQVVPSSDNHTYTATVGASWNIFDSGVTAGKVDKAKAELESAKLALAQDESDINLSLRQNYNSMREAEKRFKSTQDAVKEAEEDYFIANEKYRAGEGIMLDIIDAQTALATARQNHISAQYDYARYKAAVESDMGTEVSPSVTASE